MKAMSAEFLKLHHRKLWLVVGIMLLVQILWEMWALRSTTSTNLSYGWLYCLYQFPLLNSIMMPIVAAVVASRISDIEHKGNTFKLIETVMPAGKLFDTKFLCGAFYLVLASIVQAGAIIVVGRLKGFSGSVPYGLLGLYVLFTSSVNLTLLMLQQTLSLLLINQMAALSIGLLGGLFGLFTMFFPSWLEKLIVWGYYGVLMLVGMDWDKSSRASTLFLTKVDWGGFCILVLIFCAIYALGRALFVKKEM